MATAPDLIFVVMLLNILAGLFLLYKSIKHYQMTRSGEFLIVGTYFFSLTFFVTFRWVLTYFTDFFERAYVARDPLAWQQITGIWILLHLFWGAGIITILIHLLRLINWRQRHPVIKGVLLLIAIEGVLQAIYYNTFFIQVFYFQDWTHWLENTYTTTKYPLTNLWLFHLIPFFTPSAGLTMYFVLQGFLMALVYGTVNPVAATKEITRARMAWVVFGVIYGLRWLLNMPFLIDVPIFQDNLAFWSLFAGSIEQPIALAGEILESLATAMLMLIIAVYPETLLITEYQLLRANRLYRFASDHPEKSQGSILDYKARVGTYFQSLPPELKEEIRRKKEAAATK
ncbi:MAG: hypothetical protein ACFFE8_17170 [Candidatus Heimdallarchaeota archaeon]